MLVLAEKLGKLVAIYMGGNFPVEQDIQKCIVLPIGNIFAGLCRHHAILFKKLAAYIGLPCRIAKGCKYCDADHQSSWLVIIEDDRNFARVHITLEYEACRGFNMGKNSNEIRKILGHSFAVDNIHETMAVEVEY